MTPRLLIATVSIAFASATIAGSASSPQPYLIFRLRQQPGAPPLLLGTLCPGTDFEFFGHSRDNLDSVAMRATLRERTPEGFRFSWTVVQRSRGIEVAHIATEELIPWGSNASLKSIAGYGVDVFYSPVPANELKRYWPNQTHGANSESFREPAGPLYAPPLR